MLLAFLALAGLCVSACSHGHRESDGLCGYSLSPIGRELLGMDSRSTIQWTPDGSRIFFSYVEDVVLIGDSPFRDTPDIYAVHVSGEPVHKVMDLPPVEPAYNVGDNWMTFDLSADGSRIAYSRCAVSEEKVQVDDGDWQVENAEMFLSNIDGSNVERLTNNTYLDALPAWSPDGESIAFVSDPDRSIRKVRKGDYWVWEAATRIAIHEVATGRSREVGLPAGYAVAPIRLEWSPSGDRIAFVVLEGERYPWDLAVYTIGVDGTGLTRVSDAMSGPAWSPDGEAIAMVVPEGDEGRALYIFEADGSNPVKVNFDISGNVGGWWGTRLETGFWMGNLSWSPDGSEAAILIERFVDGSLPAVIPLGTGGVWAGMPGDSQARSHAVTAGAGGGSILASPPSQSYIGLRGSAWSPDGTQIAIRIDRGGFFTLGVIDRQGNSRALLNWERDHYR